MGGWRAGLLLGAIAIHQYVWARTDEVEVAATEVEAAVDGFSSTDHDKTTDDQDIHEFQAEVNRLEYVIINSLYTWRSGWEDGSDQKTLIIIGDGVDRYKVDLINKLRMGAKSGTTNPWRRWRKVEMPIWSVNLV